MDFNQVKELIRMIDGSHLVDFSIEFENTKINMSKNGAGAAVVNNRPVVAPAVYTPPEEKESIEEITAELTEALDEPKTIFPMPKPVIMDGNSVDSPLVGTFYESASPSEPPFVTVGSRVKKGDVLCIVEAMKIMNEITSKYDGIVKEILVHNEDMVEYGQHLFIIA
jgi:acetyl-CoA carboxylase biotin carboxyl carrier protein